MNTWSVFSPQPIRLLLVLVLCGCQTASPLFSRAKVKTSEEAANIFVSAYPPVPWSEISSKLDPGHNLTIDQARTMATQTTQVQIEQFLSTFAVGLGIGLPGATETITTTIAADGSQQTTGTRTKSTGTIPSSSGTPSAALPSDGLSPDLSKGPMTTGIDASTILTTGTALYQQAQIIDNQIKKAFFPDEYQINLITFQINLQPKRRDLNYDAYTDITLFPADWGEAERTTEELGKEANALPPVRLYPVIITDAIETTNVGRSIQALQQAALQLSGMVKGAGVSAGVARGSSKLQSVVGLDKNSLVTVGRVSDSSFRVRLGPENSGSSGLALVPRSYNVSVVVMTRWDTKESSKSV